MREAEAMARRGRGRRLDHAIAAPPTPPAPPSLSLCLDVTQPKDALVREIPA